MRPTQSMSWRLTVYVIASAAMLCGWYLIHPELSVYGQETSTGDVLPDVAPDSESLSGAEVAPDRASSGVDSETGTPPVNPPAQPSTTRPPASRGLNLFMLLSKAGWFFMLPIWLGSIAVGALSIERLIALRRGRVMPDRLVSGLGKLAGSSGGFDPRAAYRLCQQYPSSASTVVRAMLLKVGRPHAEVEYAVRESSDREANRLYARVRWLGLAAAVAPLWGLLGTVWGMMMAFYDTTQLGYQRNKAEALAEGIYTALVTTLCGLFIAIPSAIMAHYLEGRIHELFRQIDELLFTLLPQIERYEGRIRFNRRAHDDEPDEVSEAGSLDQDAMQLPSAR